MADAPLLDQLNLVVRDMEATLTFYRRLGLEIADEVWGARYAIIEDPDGNHVGIMSPSDSSRRSAAPAI